MVLALQATALLEIIDHPNATTYPNQKTYVIDLNAYVHLVPFVEDSESVFLKSIIPSRKATAKYLSRAKPLLSKTIPRRSRCRRTIYFDSVRGRSNKPQRQCGAINENPRRLRSLHPAQRCTHQHSLVHERYQRDSSLAVAEGIPYQTLVASVLHKFVEGRLVVAGAKQVS